MYNKDRIMRKLLGKPALDASPSPSSSVPDHPAASHSASLSATSSPYPISNPLRPSGSQDSTLDTGCPIDCLDRSPDGRSAILAGRHILKIVNLHGTSIQAGVDLRAAILAQPVVKNSTVSVADQLSIKDVKWLKGRGDTTIFTACANGKIFQYDLTRLGGGADGAPMEVIHMREDSRQMNALDINPSSSKMLAGSQDGIVRCFDILNPVRTHTGHLTFRATQSFKCNAGGIQCVQWSPNPNGAWNFACGTDQGVVLKWDIRKPTAPLLRINAHDAPCTSLAWHFDGDHLLSAGWDKKCAVWDVSAKADKRQKAKWTIHTPAPVADLAWRPGTWSATAQGKRAAQFAVTYDDSSRQGLNICHVWDLARPSLPFKKVHNFSSPPSALLWHDQDLLWTAGHDGLFNQFDIAYAPKVVDHVPTSVLSFSSHGDVMAFLDERPQSRRPHRSVIPADMMPPSYSTSPTTPMLSISRSESEEELAGSFLAARRARPKQKPGPNASRSSQALSTTPPGGPHAPIMALAQSIKATGIFRSHQAMTIGRVPPANKAAIYEYLSTHYLETLHELLPYQQDGEPLRERVISILHHYSKAAESIGMFRLAQVWLLLAHAMKLLLTRRLQYHLDRRSGELDRYDRARRKQKSVSLPHSAGTGRPSFAGSGDASRSGLAHSSSLDKTGTLRSLLSEGFESTSNAPTPLARPIDGHQAGYGKKLTPVDEGASFSLPAPLQRPSLRKRLDSEPLSTMSNDSDAYASTEGYDFYDTETISKAIDVPAAPRGHGGHHTASPASVRRLVPRQDSDESYGHMFSISSGSKPPTQLAASSSSSNWNHNPSSSGPLYSEIVRGASSGEFERHGRGSRLPGRNPSSLQTSASAGLSSTDASLTQSTEEARYPVTQTTMDSIDTQQGESHPRPDSFPRDASQQTASVGASPYTSFEFPCDDPERSQEADYLPWADDPPYPQPIAWEDDGGSPFGASNPINPAKIVSWALSFETRSSALNASAMVLLLRPLLRDDGVIDPFHAAAIIKQHHTRLMSMKLFTQAALLRKLCVRGWPGEPLAEWGDNYPAVFRSAQTNNVAAFICPTCHKPREINRRQNHRDRNGDRTHTRNPIWQCERCAAAMAPCAICRHHDLAETAATVAEISMELLLLRAAVHGGDAVHGGEGEEEGPLSTWWYCPGCGHGGHASCLQAWHAEVIEGEDGPVSSVDGGHGTSLYSDGCCPFDGCGHACLPGKYRVELNVARTEEVSRLVREVNRRAAAHLSGHASHGHGHAHHNQSHKHGGRVGDNSGAAGITTAAAAAAAITAGTMSKSASFSTRLAGEEELSPVSGTGSGSGPGSGPASRGMAHRRRGTGGGAGDRGSGSGAAHLPFESSMSSTGTDTGPGPPAAAVVHGDANDSIPLSRAVESVRESLAAAVGTTSGGAGGRESGGNGSGTNRSASGSRSGKMPVLRQVASAMHLGGSSGGGGGGGSGGGDDEASHTSLGMFAYGASTAGSGGSLALSSSPGNMEGSGSGAVSGLGIGGGGGSGSGTGSGIGGGGGGDRERRKSVKFVGGAGLVD